MIKIVQLTKKLKEINNLCTAINQETRKTIDHVMVNGKPLDKLKSKIDVSPANGRF
jgi:predicted transcriptional regulator